MKIQVPVKASRKKRKIQWATNNTSPYHLVFTFFCITWNSHSLLIDLISFKMTLRPIHSLISETFQCHSSPCLSGYKFIRVTTVKILRKCLERPMDGWTDRPYSLKSFQNNWNNLLNYNRLSSQWKIHFFNLLLPCPPWIFELSDAQSKNKLMSYKAL